MEHRKLSRMAEAREGLECEGEDRRLGGRKQTPAQEQCWEGPGMFVGASGAERWDECFAQSVLVPCDRHRAHQQHCSFWTAARPCEASAARPTGASLAQPSRRLARRETSHAALVICGRSAAVRVSSARLATSKGHDCPEQTPIPVSILPLFAHSRRLHARDITSTQYQLGPRSLAAVALEHSACRWWAAPLRWV